jgi:hypothetical protein
MDLFMGHQTSLLWESWILESVHLYLSSSYWRDRTLICCVNRSRHNRWLWIDGSVWCLMNSLTSYSERIALVAYMRLVLIEKSVSE